MFKIVAEAYAQAVADGDHGAAAALLEEMDQLAVAADCDRAALEKARSWRVG